MGLLFNMSPLERLFINTYNIPFENEKEEKQRRKKGKKMDEVGATCGCRELAIGYCDGKAGRCLIFTVKIHKWKPIKVNYEKFYGPISILFW